MQRRPAAYNAMMEECIKDNPKFVVLSGCQGPLIAEFMELMTLGSASSYFVGGGKRINEFCSQERGGWESYKKELDGANFIYTQKPKIYNFLAGMERYKEKLRYIPIMNCPAFHPDMTYMDYGREKIVGPMGDYHSIVATASYFAGFSQNDALDLFQPDVYRAMGFFDKSKSALQSFEKRFEESGIDVSELVASPGKVWMRTLNHPKGYAAAKIVSQALERDEICIKNNLSAVIEWATDHLAKGPEWPLYPGLRENISKEVVVKENGNIMFKSPYKFEERPVFFGLKKLIEYTYSSLEGFEMNSIKMRHHNFEDAVRVLVKCAK